ncbi:MULTISPECIES: rod shape-determining protein MreC [unclassified Granulicatella]|uniref:rod shape-determining protein MreC n=1 Tax=unclassified Granulicatella TaxID=2630493 RepID=UPI001430695C|nr:MULTISPECIES: rod shape-determining protein MreC [unclassified Granulicatella]MBF0781067.1 rod shape-determining protein MreC [Granulicatella sp. 19428wC4_WM01]
MNRFFNNKRLLFVVVTIVLLIGLTTFSLLVGNQNTVSSTGTETMSWFNRLLSAPANAISNVTNSINHLVNTYQENEELKKNMDNYFSLQLKQEALEKENAALKHELQLKKDLSDYTTVSATVISRSPDTWFNQLVINVGQDNGLEIGMLMMSNGGVVGRVSEVSATTAKVMLLTTAQENSISISSVIQTQKDGAYGVISRYDNATKRFIMSNIDLNADVQPNQTVSTSGLSGIAPSALPVGVVESVKVDDSGLFKEASIKPYGELHDIYYVTIVKRSSEKVQNE